MARHWLLAGVGCIVLASAAFGQTDAKVEALIKKLGSSSFVQREMARKELEAIGTPALDTLRRVKQNADVETNRRLAELIRVFEEKLLTEQILAPKEVHLTLKDASVHEAIAELSKISGYPVQFLGDATKINGKKITLDTGKTSFWQAFDQLCTQGGLMEKVDTSIQQSPPVINGRGRMINPAIRQANAGPIQLTPRGEEKSFVSFAGAVKTELRITRDAKAKELVLAFIVSSEPRLLNCNVAARPFIEKLRDQNGRSLHVAPEVPQTKDVSKDIGLDMIYQIEAPQPMQRVVHVRVKEENAATQLKEVLGKLTLQVDLQNVPLVKMPNVMDAAGKSANAANGGSLKVLAVNKRDNGTIELQVSIDNMAGDPFGGNVIINGGNVVIRGNVAIRGMIIGPNGVRINGGGNGNSADLPDLLDAKGQKFKLVSVQGDSVNFVNGSMSRLATIVYQANPGQAEPRDLILFGTRNHSVGVPFRFENLPLP